MKGRLPLRCIPNLFRGRWYRPRRLPPGIRQGCSRPLLPLSRGIPSTLFGGQPAGNSFADINISFPPLLLDLRRTVKTEDIIENGKVNGVTASDIQKILNLKHAWEFIMDKDVVSYPTDVFQHLSRIKVKIVPSSRSS